MDLQAVLQETDIAKKIEKLQKGRQQNALSKADVEKYLDIAQHDVSNKGLRPDKTVKKTITRADGSAAEQNVTQPVSRIALSLQEIIVERAVAFLFGNDVKLSCDEDKLLNAIQRVNKDNKIDAFNRQVARTCFQTTEVAEYWYVKDTEPNETYGFKSTKKLKCSVFSPLKGDSLYPFFDDFGDLTAFSRAFTLKDENDKDVEHFDTWTNDNYYRWKKESGGWVLESSTVNPVKKIPIVYASQPYVEWYKVQPLIDRLEKLLSNFADTNDYFASPMLFIKGGNLLSVSGKGESGKILEADGDAEAKYLAWSQVPEPIKLEIDTLLRFIFSLTQTPDISFDNVKGLGTNISGETLKMLFLDAHLKVMNKKEIFEAYLNRRYSVVKYMLKGISSALNIDADVDCGIVPYMLNSETDTISNLVTAVQGGIMSKETAIELNPFVDDTLEELKRLEDESNEPGGLDALQNEDPLNG